MTPTRAELEQLAQSPDGRRQIDALAAGVMGWTTDPDRRGMYFDGPHARTFTNEWRPATSIADAWELVEKMRTDGWFYTVEDFIETNEHMAKFDSPFFPPGGPVVEIHHIDKTAPRAITIAAIMAKRESR